jgi:hypothetical protein
MHHDWILRCPNEYEKSSPDLRRDDPKNQFGEKIFTKLLLPVWFVEIKGAAPIF